MSKPVVAREVPLHQPQPYWELEQPIQASTGRLLFRYYQNAGKLQVSRVGRGPDGKKYPVKSVTIDQEDIFRHPSARKLLLDFASD